MPDTPLQQVQDTLRLPIYQTDNIHGENSVSQLYDQQFINLIPQFVPDTTRGYITQKEQIVAKRPGFTAGAVSYDFMTGIVNDSTRCTIQDVIPITAVYDVFVAAVFDTSNSTLYVIQFRPNAQTPPIKIGSFATINDNNDYCFLTEFSQAVSGNLVPAVAVNYTSNNFTLSKSYYAATVSGVFPAASLIQITTVNFPSNQTPALITVGAFVQMNGYVYVATLDGRIWNSPINDITTWVDSNSALMDLSVNQYPDQCFGLMRYKQHIVAMGRNSIEFFDDVGNAPGSPLAPIPQVTIAFGTKSPRTFINIADQLFFMAYGSKGALGLWKLDGYTPTKLSTAFIDTAISTGSSSTIGDPYSFNMQSLTINNKATLIINGLIQQPATIPNGISPLPTNSNGVNDTFPLLANDFVIGICCYSIEDNTWWSMNIRGNPSIGLKCAGMEFSTPVTANLPNYYGQVVLYNPSGVLLTVPVNVSQGFVYTLDGTFDVAKDDAAKSTDSDFPHKPVIAVAQMNTLWFNTEKRKRVNKAKIILYTGLTASAGSATTSMYLFYARNQPQLSGGGTLLNAVTRGTPFPTLIGRYYYNNLGSGRAWSFIIVEKSQNSLVLKALELDMQQDSH